MLLALSCARSGPLQCYVMLCDVIWHREHKRYPTNWSVTNWLALNLPSLSNPLPPHFVGFLRPLH